MGTDDNQGIPGFRLLDGESEVGVLSDFERADRPDITVRGLNLFDRAVTGADGTITGNVRFLRPGDRSHREPPIDITPTADELEAMFQAPSAEPPDRTDP